MRDYTGKTIYLGIDVHKKTYAVTVICEEQVVKRDTLRADPSVLIDYCKKYFCGAQIHSAYEAGFCGFHLHRCLEAVGINNRVVHAAGIEIAVGDRVKTDKRDSLKLATHLATGRLRGIHIPSKEREDLRAVTRLRENLVRDRSRVACQLKSLLYLYGLIDADDKRRISEKWLKVLELHRLSSGLNFAMDQYISLWRHFDAQIKEVNKELEAQAEKDNKLEEVYRSAPCVGPISARVLANELGDLSQFNNERQLFSYIGLTPSEYSSGEHTCQGSITRQGKPILRKILVQIAWKAIGQDSSLEETFNQLKNRIGSKKAIVAIARKYIGRIRACFRTGELYRNTKEDRVESNERLDELQLRYSA